MHQSSENPVLLHWSARHKDWAPPCYRKSEDTVVHRKQNKKSLKTFVLQHCWSSHLSTHIIIHPPSSFPTMGWTINHKFSVCSNNYTERRDELFIIHTSSTLCKWIYGLHTTKPNNSHTAYIKMPPTCLICIACNHLPYQCSTMSNSINKITVVK